MPKSQRNEMAKPEPVVSLPTGETGNPDLSLPGDRDEAAVELDDDDEDDEDDDGSTRSLRLLSLSSSLFLL